MYVCWLSITAWSHIFHPCILDGAAFSSPALSIAPLGRLIGTDSGMSSMGKGRDTSKHIKKPAKPLISVLQFSHREAPYIFTEHHTTKFKSGPALTWLRSPFQFIFHTRSCITSLSNTVLYSYRLGLRENAGHENVGPSCTAGKCRT